MNSASTAPPSLSRRRFLKSTAVASLGMSALDLSRSAHAAGSDIIRVGMIGCGGRNAGAAVQALTADGGARLVAMGDIFLDRIYGDVFDHHSVVYEFENGVRAYAFCRTTTGCYDEDSSIVLGSKGKASIKACRISGENNWRWEGQCDPYQVEHDRLFAAIRSGNPLNSGDYMARSTLITVMGQLSCYTGKEVTWEQVSQSDFYYPPRPEECRDDMEAPTNLSSDDTYPVPVPGQTVFSLQPATDIKTKA